ncbi:hypothetical protein PBCV1_a525R [Paramecium bursaria Chlorella virus 1]|uniref:Uncharacterized protein n=1 Tax=Paramecium bursaria Chlorella virus 1 TaxID=10506 RepID=Q98575_PBCV1|nr:hypothetical protein PBCV1_a525R [Paramecium bursaria Chlorella virus 1]AAC96892.1 hypothetical protein [Paramecium bursaria Chlorella virus 1]
MAMLLSKKLRERAGSPRAVSRMLTLNFGELHHISGEVMEKCTTCLHQTSCYVVLSRPSEEAVCGHK